MKPAALSRIRSQTSPASQRGPKKVSIQARLARVKFFLCDVDGVLTDGTVTMNGCDESKRFHIRDGLGLRLLQNSGIQIGWISNRPSAVTLQRATELRVDFLSQEKSSKVDIVTRLLANSNLAWEDIAYMGDDVVDLGVLRRAGLAVVPANGISEARALAHYVTEQNGGEGAVREVIEMILKAQNKWTQLIAEFSA